MRRGERAGSCCLGPDPTAGPRSAGGPWSAIEGGKDEKAGQQGETQGVWIVQDFAKRNRRADGELRMYSSNRIFSGLSKLGNGRPLVHSWSMVKVFFKC